MTEFNQKLFFLIIFFTICFYLIIQNLNISTINMVITETKIILYMLIGIFFYFISDMLKTESASLAYLISGCLLISYISNYILEKYFKGKFEYKILISLSIGIGIYVVLLGYIYYILKPQSENTISLFISTYNKNYKFCLFFFLLLIVYTAVLKLYSLDSFKNKIMQPAILGIFLMIFVFSFIIYICQNIGVINSKQYLDTFLVLLTLLIACIYIYIYMFLGSLSTICDQPKNQREAKKQQLKSSNEETSVSFILLASIFLLLWMDDSKVWSQINYLLFIIISIVVIASMFYYSTKYPSTGLLSFWLLIEWIITWYKNGSNAKHSIHYVAIKDRKK